MVHKLIRHTAEIVTEVGTLPIYLLSALVPKRKTLWVFGAWLGYRYADNARYLFEYVDSHRADIRAVWITRKRALAREIRARGYEAYTLLSPRGLLAASRAAICVVTHDARDVNGWLTRRAHLVNVTHGTPLKRIGCDAKLQRFGSLTRIFDQIIRPALPSYRTPEFFFVASERVRERFVSAFEVPREHVIPLGLPRWAALRDDAHASPQANALTSSMAAKRLILYAPTQRRAGSGVLSMASIAGFERFVSWLRSSNTILIVRPHAAGIVSDNLSELGATDCVRFVTAEELDDVNELLAYVDVLITDYSSVIYDYALLRKAFVMLAYDFDEYAETDAGVYGDYRKEFRGSIADDWDDVLRLISRRSQLATEANLEALFNHCGQCFDGYESWRAVKTLRHITGLS